MQNSHATLPTRVCISSGMSPAYDARAISQQPQPGSNWLFLRCLHTAPGFADPASRGRTASHRRCFAGAPLLPRKGSPVPAGGAIRATGALLPAQMQKAPGQFPDQGLTRNRAEKMVASQHGDKAVAYF